MFPCKCIDDSSSIFRVVSGSHYWQPVIEKKVKVGDILFYEESTAGVYLSETNNKSDSFIFLSLEDFEKHFQRISDLRDKKIDDLLKIIKSPTS